MLALYPSGVRVNAMLRGAERPTYRCGYLKLISEGHWLKIRGIKNSTRITTRIAGHDVHMVVGLGLPGIHPVVLKNVEPCRAECLDQGTPEQYGFAVNRGEELHVEIERRCDVDVRNHEQCAVLILTQIDE